MASKKKQPRHAPAKPAEIFYFSEDGECSRTPKWARRAAGDDPPKSESAAGSEWDLKTPRGLPAPGPAARAKAAAPVPSSLAERMSRTDRTRAAHASSLKGGLGAASKIEALSREATDPNAEMPSPSDFMAGCCSHPRHEESLQDATARRLKEEMGMSCEIKEAFHFTYKADVSQGLIEHEIDHVFIGITDDTPVINTDEVASWKYETMENVRHDIAVNPQNYTAWFKIAFEEVLKHFNKQ